ncbi:MAG: nicotinate (nicotinamide) nucleotide adenylyltransferase [Nitrosarchaeum sp.]|nr:nicotinate (nicotinamide) nucleotide adenylyltransferase [Nitrosarchaeum sp.]
MKIAIFGGAFDPITTGHVHVVNEVLNVVDHVIVMPCYKHAFDKQMTNAIDRLMMCKLAFLHNPKVEVSDYEIDNKTSGKTIEKINDLKVNYPADSLSWVIGLDNAYDIIKWYQWESLIKSIPFIVVPREGYSSTENNWYLSSPHILLKCKPVLMSSSMIRELFAAKNYDKLKELLHPLIYAYIFYNKLYGVQ